MEQTEMLPKTAAERARTILLYLEDEVEKRQKAYEAAEEKLDDARARATKMRRVLESLERADTAVLPSVEEVEGDTIDLIVDPETGEVLSAAAKDEGDEAPPAL